MATMTKDATLSLRLIARAKSGLDGDARMKGIPSGTAALRRQFPGLDVKSIHDTDWAALADEVGAAPDAG